MKKRNSSNKISNNNSNRGLSDGQKAGLIGGGGAVIGVVVWEGGKKVIRKVRGKK